MMIYRHKIVLTLILLMLTAALPVGCASSATTLPTTAPTTAAPTAAASTTATSQNLNGAHVRVLGLWSGPELDSFMTVKAAWEKDTGGIVD
jgi:ABC-type glycerol-3-phosphate transport system substrate-binding protein